MYMGKLARFNEWWATRHVKGSLLKEYKRPAFHEVVRYVDDRQIIVIYGLRRVGKTTIMYQVIDTLLRSGVDSNKILYFSFDESSVDFEDLIKTYEREVLKSTLSDSGRVFIFLDEVQKVRDWQEKIKVYYDLYPDIKFFLSGSASISVQKRAKESLAGRIYDFPVYPMSFSEFLEFKSIKFELGDWKIYENSVAPLFYDYLSKGGFPEIIEETDENKIHQYIRNTVVDRILMIDLPQEFGLKDIELLRTLVEMIGTNPGFTLNYDSLSKDLKRSKPTVINYFNYLEYALVIKLVKNLRKSVMSSSRKMKKVYFSNAAFCFPFLQTPLDGALFGKVVENFVVQETGANHYFRINGKELDFVVRTVKGFVPIEVKYGKFDIVEIAGLMKKVGFKWGIIVTKDSFEKKFVGDIEIVAVPAWLFSAFYKDIIGSR